MVAWPLKLKLKLNPSQSQSQTHATSQLNKARAAQAAVRNDVMKREQAIKKAEKDLELKVRFLS